MAGAPGTSFDLIVRKASLSYAGAPLFRRLDFTLHRGQCTCLLGPSGVGKSSLLRLIAGLLAPEEGEVACSDQRPLAGRLAWMGQDANLLPWLSVMGNITLGARLRGERRDQAAAEALLARVGLTGQRDQAPATLSGGQRQRVGLARALAARPPVLLMDEPLGALDPLTRDALQQEVRRLHDRLGLTTVLVTHDMAEALLLADRIVVIQAGQVRGAGAPRELLARPPHPYIARLMETPRRQADRLEELAGGGAGGRGAESP